MQLKLIQREQTRHIEIHTFSSDRENTSMDTHRQRALYKHVCAWKTCNAGRWTRPLDVKALSTAWLDWKYVAQSGLLSELSDECLLTT